MKKRRAPAHRFLRSFRRITVDKTRRLWYHDPNMARRTGGHPPVIFDGNAGERLRRQFAPLRLDIFARMLYV